jgi:hypothetical protein
MNEKQTVPFIATFAPAIAAIAPAVIIGVPIFFAIKWLLSDDDKKPETTPTNTETENQRSGAESAAFHQIPVKSVSVPVAAPPLSPVPIIKSVSQTPQPPVKKKFVTRKDLATVFNHGTRSLTRTAAVGALRKLGFGRTAAYAALTPDGRFSVWLQFAPDGIITWAE